MAKSFTLIDASKVISKRPCITNWNLCVLCQLDINAALECPTRSTRPTSGSGYKSLAEHLMQFQSLGRVPMDIDINRLDDGDGIETTLMRHQACWHKTCQLNFNQTKLDRLNKKVVQEENEIDATCLCCGKAASSEGLHNASTYDIDRKVYQCALELNDTALLAQLTWLPLKPNTILDV